MSRPALLMTTPAKAARAILDAMFAGDLDRTAAATTHRSPDADRLAPFQQTAVQHAEHTLARRGGVLIADPVGTGKTHTGAALAIAARDAGRPTLVVVPAPLRRHWNTTLRSAPSSHGENAAPIVMVSHTDLSRDSGPDDSHDFGRVVVDEAHAFRNPNTRRYAALARLTRAADVVLLTATPIGSMYLTQSCEGIIIGVDETTLTWNGIYGARSGQGWRGEVGNHSATPIGMRR